MNKDKKRRHNIILIKHQKWLFKWTTILQKTNFLYLIKYEISKTVLKLIKLKKYTVSTVKTLIHFK